METKVKRKKIPSLLKQIKKPAGESRLLIGLDVDLHPALILDEVGYYRNGEHLALISQISPIEENEPQNRNANAANAKGDK